MTTDVRTREDLPTDPLTTRAALLVDIGVFTPFYDLNLAAALAAEGWAVELVTSEYEFEDVSPGVGSRLRAAALFRREGRGLNGHLRGPRLALKAVLYLVDLIRLDRRLAQLSPSIVHIQWAHLPWIDKLLWTRWRRRGWNVVYTVHDASPLRGTTPRVLAHSYSRLPDRADAVVVHTESERALVLKMGAKPKRLHVIPPASPFAPDSPPPSRTAARRALGLEPDQQVVLFFGFLKPYKGLTVLLRSLPLLKRNVRSAKLLIAGEVMEPRTHYERLTAELGISREVDWRPGFVPSAEVGTFFSAADVVALPYIDASSSGVLLAAYSCRRPVVVSAVGGLPELVVPGETGLIVPPGDPLALAGALSELLCNPQLAGRMGEKAFELSRERYTWPGVARRLDALYSELLDRAVDAE
jgi:glycosyltransferase involved in cell wall biosynthesis